MTHTGHRTRSNVHPTYRPRGENDMDTQKTMGQREERAKRLDRLNAEILAERERKRQEKEALGKARRSGGRRPGPTLP